MLFPKFDALAYLDDKSTALEHEKRLGALDDLGALILPFDKELMALSPDKQERFEERAAIKEYDGGLKRHHAEKAALCEIVELSQYIKLLSKNSRQERL